MKTLVLGAAVSGIAAAKLARTNGDEVVLYDRRPISDEGFEVHSGDWDPTILDSIDQVVTSPGFPEHDGPIPGVLAAGIPLISEMEYAAAQMTIPYAAVTGTNGKTTVTSIAADMLVRSGIDAKAAGNIGTAVSDLVAEPPEALVIEASSFQLRFIDCFHPRAAAILNIAPDHLDWHRNLAEYIAAKQRIFANQTEHDLLVFDADDPGAAGAVQPARSRRVPVSGSRVPPGGSGRSHGALRIAGHSFPDPGFDNAYTVDLIVAAELAGHLGATPHGIGEALAAFVPGRHRRTLVGRWEGVSWVNDSKATNPHAAVASVRAYESVVLIGGGRNKGLDLAPIVAEHRVRAIIGIGEAADELAAIAEPERFHGAADMETAVRIADEVAQPGDTVLLAPGCASFDMFTSYGERGEVFTQLVLERKGERHGN